VLGKPVRLALPELAGQGFYELLDGACQGGQAYHGRNIEVQLDSGNGAAIELRLLDFLYQPLKDACGRAAASSLKGST
jgi:hypothetical protein